MVTQVKGQELPAIMLGDLQRAPQQAHNDPAPPVRQRLNQEEKTCLVLVYFTQVCIYKY